MAVAGIHLNYRGANMSAGAWLLIFAAIWQTAGALAATGLSPAHNCTAQLDAGLCGPACQTTICSLLVSLYNAQNGPVWFNQSGWQAAASAASCQAYLAGAPGTPPAYCSWHGVSCCTAASSSCAFPYAPSKLDLSVNNLNGSISSDAFLSSLAGLDSCGLRSLLIAAGNMTGVLDPR